MRDAYVFSEPNALGGPKLQFNCPVCDDDGQMHAVAFDNAAGGDVADEWRFVLHCVKGNHSLVEWAEALDVPPDENVKDGLPARLERAGLSNGRDGREREPMIPEGGWRRAAFEAWADQLFRRKHLRDYLRRRHITEAVIEQELLGWDGEHLVIPFIENGTILTYKRRRWTLKAHGTRYLNAKGFDGARAGLYPPSRRFAGGWAKRPDECCLLVAGELDALALLSVGLPALSVPCGAGMWRDAWAEQLPRRVVVCFDNPPARDDRRSLDEGRVARERVARLRTFDFDAHQLDLRQLGLKEPKADVTDYLTAAQGNPGRLRATLERMMGR